MSQKESGPGDWIGRSAERSVRVSAEMIDGFAELSGDKSPIHMDDGPAQRRGFQGRVAHGLLLGALVSGLIGMDVPGAQGVLQSIKLSFHNPCYVGEQVRIAVQVTEFFESVQVVVLKVRITGSTGVTLATGSVQSGVGGSNDRSSG